MKKKESKLWAVLALILTVILCLASVSCRVIRVNGGSHHSDSIRIEQRVDTFVQVLKDSVTIQLPCSDSISVAYVDRYHTDTRYIRTLLHDTIRTERIDSIPYPVEVERVVTKNSGFANFCIWVFWILVTAIVCIVGCWVIRKFVLHL